MHSGCDGGKQGALRSPRPQLGRPLVVPHFWQAPAPSSPFPFPKRPRVEEEETNDIPQWIEREASTVLPVEQEHQTDQDQLPKERLENQICEQGIQTETELEDLETKSRLLEQKLEYSRKEEYKIEQRILQLANKHRDFVVQAQTKEDALEKRIKESETLNSALKEENETLKTEAIAKGEKIFSEVQKFEHSHFAQEKELKEEIEREKNKREEWKTELETRIRSLKDEHDAVRAAHKLLHEKTEMKLKGETSEAEKMIKSLKEDKKRLRTSKTSSEMLVRKQKHEIQDLKTQAKKEKQVAAAKLKRRKEEIGDGDKCIRALKDDNEQLKVKIKTIQSDAQKKIEELEEKLKLAESANHYIGTKLEQLRQNGVLDSVHSGSDLSKSQESLVLMTKSRDAAVQKGIQLSSKLSQMETDANEREEHTKLLLSGMTPNEFVAQHQQLIQQKQSTEAKLENMAEENEGLRKKNDQLKKRAAETNAKLTEAQAGKDSLAKELQDAITSLKKETDQTKKLNGELSRIQTLLKEKSTALEQLQKKEVRNTELRKKCEKLEKEKTEEKKVAKAEIENVEKKLQSLELEANELKKAMGNLAADVEPKLLLLASRNKELNDVKHKLTLVNKKHPTQEEAFSQTEPSDFGSKAVQMSDMEVEFLSFLNAKDGQMAAVNDKLAKVQQQLVELGGQD